MVLFNNVIELVVSVWLVLFGIVYSFPAAFLSDRSARTANHIKSTCGCLTSQSAQRKVDTKQAALASNVAVVSMTQSCTSGRREGSGLHTSGDRQRRQPANLISLSALVPVWRSVKLVWSLMRFLLRLLCYRNKAQNLKTFLIFLAFMGSFCHPSVEMHVCAKECFAVTLFLVQFGCN